MFTKKEILQYYEKDYLDLNPSLHSEDSKFKASEILHLLKEESIGKMKTIVELGCGSGLVSKELAKAIHSTTVGCDISGLILQKAKKMNPNLLPIRADCEQTPLRDKSVDVVLLIDVIEHLICPQACIAESARISKKYVIIRTPIEDCLYHNLRKSKDAWGSEWRSNCGHLWQFNQTFLRRMLEENNLKVIKAQLSKMPFSWIKRGSYSIFLAIVLSRLLPSSTYEKLFPGELTILAKPLL
jgi:ubiquinone/menaquinone biosynthesis C-methylase UbiE